MPTQNIDIIVNMRGDRVVKRNLEDIGRSGKQAGDALGFLKGILGTIGFLALANQAKQYLDVTTRISNRLKLVTSSSAELAAVQDRLFNVANKTRSGYEETVNVYSKMALASKNLGLSQNEVIRTVELLNKTVAISGATGSEAAAGLLQFGQAIGSGQLRGDELRSVTENLQGLALQLAKGLGLKGGIAELRALAEAGKLTSEQVIKALQKQGVEIDQLYAKSLPTIDQSLTVINNKMIRFVENIDKAIQANEALRGALGFVSDNFSKIAQGVLIAAGVITAFFIPAIIKATAALATGLFAVLAANPLGLLVAGLAAGVAAFITFQDEVTKVAAGVADVLLDQWDIVAEMTVLVFRNLGPNLEVIFGDILNGLLAKFESFINSLGSSLNSLPMMAGTFNPVSLGRMDTSSAQGIIAANNSSALSSIQAKTNAQRFTLTSSSGGSSLFDLSGKPSGGGSGGFDANGAKKAKDEWDKLSKSLDPVGAAMRQLTQDQALLNSAFRSGKVTLEEYTRMNEMLKLKYQEQIDPLATLNREVEKNIQSTMADTREKRVVVQLQEWENQLRKQGVAVTDEQRRSLEQLAVVQDIATNPSPLEQYRRSLEITGDTIEEALVKGIKGASDAMAGFILDGKKGLEDFGGLLQSVAKEFMSFAIQQAIFKPLMSGLGLFGSANGNVFSGGVLQPYAKGGIVSSPTLFPMANGATGLMGEAGAEAIMPLRRLNNGRLGVEASGGGGGVFAPTLNITVPPGTSEQQSERMAMQLQQEMRNLFAEFLREQRRPGNQLNPMGTM